MKLREIYVRKKKRNFEEDTTWNYKHLNNISYFLDDIYQAFVKFVTS